MFQWPEHGTDVHFDVVRLPLPDSFVSDGSAIRFADSKTTRSGPGVVTASVSDVSGNITLGLSEFVDAFNESPSVPGRIIPDEEFAEVSPVEPTMPDWFGSGGHKSGQTFSTETVGQTFSFTLTKLVVTYAVDEAAFTREIFRGPRLPWLRQASPYGEGGFRIDRVEGRALGRRTTIRDLQTGEDANSNTIAVIYDGSPHADNEGNAMWLALSVLAGQALAPAISETYDSGGHLLTRTFRPGYFTAARSDSPFHVHYAPFQSEWLDTLVDGVAKRLRDEFPIDVVIAHAQDATEGSMERSMQSYLLALHVASEAWARASGSTTIYPKEQWITAAARMTDAALAAVDFLSADMQEVVRRKLGDANNSSTSARMRSFCAAMGIAYSGPDKKAVGLRNVLFHDGYLQRRFHNLDIEKRQERLDQMFRLRDFVYRTIFALVDFEHPFVSAVNPYKSIVAHNIDNELP